MSRLLFKNKDDTQRWGVVFSYDAFPSQCGMRLMFAIEVYEINGKHSMGKYLKNYPADCKAPFKLFLDHLTTGNFANIVLRATGFDNYSPFYEGDGDPICARIILSDVVKNGGPHMTSMFAEMMKLPCADIIQNPNTRNDINMWWVDLPEKEEDTYEDDDE